MLILLMQSRLIKQLNDEGNEIVSWARFREASLSEN